MRRSGGTRVDVGLCASWVCVVVSFLAVRRVFSLSQACVLSLFLPVFSLSGVSFLSLFFSRPPSWSF